ncbi:MAG: PilZ domain-containing protein [Caulobacterales bacterium]
MGLPAPSQVHIDRRTLERTPTTLRGKVFPGPRDCVIADFSKHGARLRFDARPALGERLVVVVWSSGLAFEAVTRWRSGDEVGVQFTSSRDLRRPAPAHLAAIQALWLKRRPRMGRRKLIAHAAIIDKRSRWPRSAGWQTPRPTTTP